VKNGLLFPKRRSLGQSTLRILASVILLAVFYFPFKSGLDRFLHAARVAEATNAFAAQAVAQQAPIQVRTALVQVDAFVTDKDGKRISNLNASNFQLSEDNQAQRLAGVDYFDASTEKFTANTEPIYIDLEGANDAQTLRQIGHDHRLIVLFLDETTMFPEDVERSLRAAQDFVKNQMTPADLVAIATYYMELDVSTGFTNDRQVLSDALEALLPGKNRGANAIPPSAGTSLIATAALTKMLAQIPGRKSVMHFTGGITQRASDAFDDAAQLTASTDAANDHNASLYEVDARGLVTICLGGKPCYCMEYWPPERCQPVRPSRNTLYTLAADTGGELFADKDDFKAIFREVQNDSTGYYMLSYQSSNQKHDGAYRHFSIKLIGVPGGHVKYRPGYVAPLDKAPKKK
jgi:VWFA-related protein